MLQTNASALAVSQVTSLRCRHRRVAVHSGERRAGASHLNGAGSRIDSRAFGLVSGGLSLGLGLLSVSGRFRGLGLRTAISNTFQILLVSKKQLRGAGKHETCSQKGIRFVRRHPF